jgi:hypothetical protein
VVVSNNYLGSRMENRWRLTLGGVTRGLAALQRSPANV